MSTTGPHGLTEVVYAYVSMAHNNGSAFGGLAGNTMWYNVTGGITMLIGKLNPDGTYACYSSTVPERVLAYRQLNNLAPKVKVPVDAVTASASGLDPDISIANARLQAPRVAAARNLPVATVLGLVNRHVNGYQWGFLGEKTVNVVDLNLALDGLKP